MPLSILLSSNPSFIFQNPTTLMVIGPFSTSLHSPPKPPISPLHAHLPTSLHPPATVTVTRCEEAHTTSLVDRMLSFDLSGAVQSFTELFILSQSFVCLQRERDDARELCIFIRPICMLYISFGCQRKHFLFMSKNNVCCISLIKCKVKSVCAALDPDSPSSPLILLSTQFQSPIY